MSKFNKVLNKFLKEDNQPISTQQQNTLQKYLKTAPQPVQDTLGAMTKAQDPDPNHALFSDVINPKTNTKFSSLNPDQQKDFLERLTKAGVFPQQQQQQQPQKNENPSKNTTQNPPSMSSGNPTTDQGQEGEGNGY
jgi:hypothetical protein